MIAVRWLGGQASDALTGDAVLLDLLRPDDHAAPAILVRRRDAVSHRAMMSQHDPAQPDLDAMLERAGAGKPGA
jgi:hypothetical protein